MNDILDLHTHTIASGHAYNTLYEMARSASEKGVRILGVSDHAPKMPGTCHPYHFNNARVLPRELFGVKVLRGCEFNILDYHGTVDSDGINLGSLDYALASIHEPCYTNGTITENTNAYLGAMKRPKVHIIAHPDDNRFPIDYDTLAAAAKEHHVLLEVNCSSLRPMSHRAGARQNYLNLLEYCIHYQTTIILGSDAHCECDVKNHALGISLLEELQFPEELIVNTSMEKLAAFIPMLNDLFHQGVAHD